MPALALIESLSLPGNPHKANEDAFGIGDDAAVVMDGATGLGEQLVPGASDAAWLATFGARRLMTHLHDGDTPKTSLRAALTDAEHSFTALRKRAPKENYEIPHASMMLTRVVEGTLEALWFGDCALLIKQQGKDVEIVGDALDKRTLEAARAAKLAAKHGLSPAAGVNRPEYLAALRKARNYANTEKGFWIFAPQAAAADHVESARLAVSAGTFLLLCTDGFLALASDYRRYDANSLIAAAKRSGLAALGGELRTVEASDPEGVRFPRFKTSDDATALLLCVT